MRQIILSLLPVVFLVSFMIATTSHADSVVQKKSQVVILGTGNPNADPERSGPSVAIVVNDTPYIIDFGPGVVRRAAAAFRKGVKGLEVKRLKTAFVTHLHSDHTVGFADLIFTPWTLERKEPLDSLRPQRHQSDDFAFARGLRRRHLYTNEGA